MHFSLTKLVCCLILFLNIQTLFSQPKFEDKAVVLGVVANYGVSLDGGGVSFADFNNDGWDDISITSASGQPVLFFQNTNGAFSPITFNFTDGNFRTKQVLWVDFDNDEDKDIFVTSDSGLNKLYRNNGNLNFTDISVNAGFFGVNQLTTSASFGDYNNDGFLDVYLAKYDFNFNLNNKLYENNGNGTFTDVTSQVGLDGLSALSLGSVFFDFNNDGWQDIYVINDKVTTENVLYKNNGDNSFTDVSISSGTNVTMDAMSATIEDFNNDGWLDIYITNTDSVDNMPVGNALMLNNGNETFTNIAGQTGTFFDSYGWGAIFFDADLDTFNDIYVSGFYTEVQSSFLPSAFFHNQGDDTCIIPENVGLENDTEVSYSNALGDFNNDGKADILVMNDDANVFLWENQAVTTNNYLKVKLTGIQSNKDGIGSWIEISSNGKTQYRYTLCGEGYLGQNSNTEFFGVGSASSIDYVKVTWLSGLVDVYYNVAINQTMSIVEGSALSIEEFNTEGFKIFPNPSQDYITIESQNNSEFTLTVFDVSGRKILAKQYSNNVVRVELSQLKKGVYFFNILSKNKVYTKKIVLN